MQREHPEDLPPYAWVDEWVSVTFYQGGREVFGWLASISDLGIELRRHASSTRTYETFHPWTSVREIRPRPDMAPPPPGP